MSTQKTETSLEGWVGDHQCPSCEIGYQWRDIAFHLWFSFSPWNCPRCGSTLGFESIRHLASIVAGLMLVALVTAPVRPLAPWPIILAVIVAITLIGGVVSSIQRKDA